MSPGTEFPRNQWYVAAYGSEITDELFARTICGEPLVFWRDSAGHVVALADRCVHRRFPLSQSNRVGDTIVCGYHGFTYDGSGACVAVPGQKRSRAPPGSAPIPSSSRTHWSGSGSATVCRRRPMPFRVRRGSQPPGGRPCAAWNRWPRGTRSCWTT